MRFPLDEKVRFEYNTTWDAGCPWAVPEKENMGQPGTLNAPHVCSRPGVRDGRGLASRNYRPRAPWSSSAKALGGACFARLCFLPPRRDRSAGGAAAIGVAPGAVPDFGAPLGRGGWAGFARSKRSSRGARSKRRMIAFISSWFGASMKAKPLDSWVSGLRMTLMESATRFSAVSQDLISSAVTQTGRFPRNTVQLTVMLITPLVGICGTGLQGSAHYSIIILA